MDCGIVNCIAGLTPVDNRTVTGILTENFAYTELYRVYQSDAVFHTTRMSEYGKRTAVCLSRSPDR